MHPWSETGLHLSGPRLVLLQNCSGDGGNYIEVANPNVHWGQANDRNIQEYLLPLQEKGSLLISLKHATLIFYFLWSSGGKLSKVMKTKLPMVKKMARGTWSQWRGQKGTVNPFLPAGAAEGC